MFYKKAVLKYFLQNSKENICAGVSFSVGAGAASDFIKKETPVEVFSCEFCEIFKNALFTEDLRFSEISICRCP